MAKWTLQELFSNFSNFSKITKSSTQQGTIDCELFLLSFKIQLSPKSRSILNSKRLPPKCFYPKSHIYTQQMKNLKKKLSHMIENELQPLPKTKTKHLRQLFNQPKSSGVLPKESECKSEKGQNLTFFQWRNGLFKNYFQIFLIFLKSPNLPCSMSQQIIKYFF